MMRRQPILEKIIGEIKKIELLRLFIFSKLFLQ